MRIAYKVLAYLVAAEVAVQAMVMVWAISGLVKWVDDGGVFDMSIMESEGTPFPEIAGIMVHGNNGFFVIPGLALLLLIVSFFTKVRGAIKWAAIVFALVVVQVLLGDLGHDFTWVVRCTASMPWRCSPRLSTPVVGCGLRRRLLLSSLRRVPPPRCDDAPFLSPATRHSAGVAVRSADRGNRGDRGTTGVVVAGQLGTGGVFGDGHGLPGLRRRGYG